MPDGWQLLISGAPSTRRDVGDSTDRLARVLPCRADRDCGSACQCHMCHCVRKVAVDGGNIGVNTLSACCAAGRNTFEHRRFRVFGGLRRDAAADHERSGQDRGGDDRLQHRHPIGQRRRAVASHRLAKPAEFLAGGVIGLPMGSGSCCMSDNSGSRKRSAVS